jgi:hypothetical protein
MFFSCCEFTKRTLRNICALLLCVAMPAAASASESLGLDAPTKAIYDSLDAQGKTQLLQAWTERVNARSPFIARLGLGAIGAGVGCCVGSSLGAFAFSFGRGAQILGGVVGAVVGAGVLAMNASNTEIEAKFQVRLKEIVEAHTIRTASRTGTTARGSGAGPASDPTDVVAELRTTSHQ